MIGTGVAFVCASDKRIKTEIYPLETCSSTIMKLQPCSYQYIDKKMGSREVVGFIAQEVESVIPCAVTLNKQNIPDIYIKGVFVSEDTIQLQEYKECKGEIIIYHDNKEHRVHVIKQSDFLITISKPIGKFNESVFIYGHEVDDFHNINTDPILSVTVKALQEVITKQMSQEDIIKRQEERIQKLEKAIELLLLK
jgi:hypothetical protein